MSSVECDTYSAWKQCQHRRNPCPGQVTILLSYYKAHSKSQKTSSIPIYHHTNTLTLKAKFTLSQKHISPKDFHQDNPPPTLPSSSGNYPTCGRLPAHPPTHRSSATGRRGRSPSGRRVPRAAATNSSAVRCRSWRKEAAGTGAADRGTCRRGGQVSQGAWCPWLCLGGGWEEIKGRKTKGDKGDDAASVTNAAGL